MSWPKSQSLRRSLAEHFITFDPADVDEKLLLTVIAAAKEGKDFQDVEPHEFGGGFDQTEDLRIPVREILDIAGDIDGQIYMRDFKLIDQSDMSLVSLVPELPGGVPASSSGSNANCSTREHTKEVYVVWKPAKSRRHGRPQPESCFGG